MICVLSVSISLLELSCIQRDLFCFIRMVIIAMKQLLIMQQATQYSPFHYMASLITLNDLALFSQGKRIPTFITKC